MLKRVKSPISGSEVVKFNRYLERGYPIKAASKHIGWNASLGSIIKKLIWGKRKRIGEFCAINKIIHPLDYPIYKDG